MAESEIVAVNLGYAGCVDSYLLPALVVTWPGTVGDASDSAIWGYV